MAARVDEQNQISINGELYKLAAPVVRQDVTQPPLKSVVGEALDESNPWASSFAQDDFRDGIGRNVLDLPGDQRRLWWGTVQTRHKAHIVNPRLATTTEEGPSSDVQVLAEFKNEIYATYGTVVHVYGATSDTWGSSVRTLLNNATDWAEGILHPSGTPTETLVIATGSEVDFATDSATWDRNTTDIAYVVFWKDLLWGIDKAGQLYYTDDLGGDWTPDARLQRPNNYVVGLEVAYGPDREKHIYAMTREGPYVHDDVNARFERTDHELPYHPNSVGHEVWRGRLFNSAGLTIYDYPVGSENPIVTVMGPDLDDGLPSDRRGVIAQLLKSHLDLIAVIDSSSLTGPSELTFRGSGGMGSSRNSVFGASGGEATILGWNERGWEVKWASGAAARAITAAVVSNAYNTYRLWWAHNQQVLYMDLPVDVANPAQDSNIKYASPGLLETGWFDAGVANQKRLGLDVVVDSTHPTTSETIKIEYATDEVGQTETYTELATKSASGEAEYSLPTTSDNSGKAFRYWKFKLTFSRGSNTRSPILHKIFLRYRKRVDALWGSMISLNLSDPEAATGSIEQMKNLETARYTKPLVEVTWVNDDSSGDPQNYKVDVIGLQFVEQSGLEGPKGALVTIVEPRQSTSR